MKDNKVDWMQEIWIPAQVPLVIPKLRLTVWDDNTARSNTLVGTLEFDLEKYIHKSQRSEEFGFFWEDIYGAPIGPSGSHTT